VNSWLSRHQSFHLHLIPTASSWLNMVERWFREITDKRIRRSTFKSVPDLVAAIKDIWKITIIILGYLYGLRLRKRF